MSKSRKSLEVAILVSTHSPSSLESVNFGCLLGGSMALTGKALVSVVDLPLSAEETPKDTQPRKYLPQLPIKIVPFKANKPLIIQEGLDVYASTEKLQTADFIIVTVDSSDTSRAKEIIMEMRIKNLKKEVGIVSLQRGVKNSAQIVETFTQKGVVVLEGAVGVEASRNFIDNCITSTTTNASIVLERITKDKERVGNIFADLLEGSGVPVLYRRHLSTHTWGIIIFQIFGVVVKKAAQEGKWAPDISACSYLPLNWLEMILCLPTLVFYVLGWMIFGFRKNVPSALQLDLQEGLSTTIDQSLGEIEILARKYRAPTPILSSILNMVRDRAAKKDGVSIIKPEKLYEMVGKPCASQKKLTVLLVKITCIVLLLLLVLLLFL